MKVSLNSSPLDAVIEVTAPFVSHIKLSVSVVAPLLRTIFAIKPLASLFNVTFSTPLYDTVTDDTPYLKVAVRFIPSFTDSMRKEFSSTYVTSVTAFTADDIFCVILLSLPRLSKSILFPSSSKIFVPFEVSSNNSPVPRQSAHSAVLFWAYLKICL